MFTLHDATFCSSIPSYMFDWVDFIPQAGTKNLASELLQAQLQKKLTINENQSLLATLLTLIFPLYHVPIDIWRAKYCIVLCIASLA